MMADTPHSAHGSSRRSPGTVFLVGAGPGDPGLLTLRAKECIELADVLVYDYLANPLFLHYAKPGAEKIYAGKKAGDHALKQGDTNALLIQKALEGKTVTRLKGGDPFVFGRGGEEAQELVAAGVPFDTLPPEKTNLEPAPDEMPVLCLHACSLLVASARTYIKKKRAAAGQ